MRTYVQSSPTVFTRWSLSRSQGTDCVLNSLDIVAPPPLRPVSPAETLQYFMHCSVLVFVYETAKNKKPQNSESFVSIYSSISSLFFLCFLVRLTSVFYFFLLLLQRVLVSFVQRKVCDGNKAPTNCFIPLLLCSCPLRRA